MLFLYRIIKLSFQDISRNIWLSLATLMVLLLALFSINSLVAVRFVSDGAIAAVKSKIDISLYLQPDSTDAQISDLRTQIKALPNVAQVDYISKQDAINSFRIKYANNPEVLSALQELGQNPLSPSLVIRPQDFDQSDLVINELKTITNPIIESQNFSDNTTILKKITSITKRINEIGLLIISIFIIISLLVVYNAIRMAIYTHRQEIEIMRLVGASNHFIYWPYLFSALIYSFFSVLIMIALFYPLLTLLQPYLETFFAGYNINILAYFLKNFLMIFGVQFLALVFINALASLLAVRKYTRV